MPLTERARAAFPEIGAEGRTREHGPLGPGEIHERYAWAVEDPRTKRTVRTYLSKMTQYNLLRATGTSRDREYALVSAATPSPS